MYAGSSFGSNNEGIASKSSASVDFMGRVPAGTRRSGKAYRVDMSDCLGNDLAWVTSFYLDFEHSHVTLLSSLERFKQLIRNL